MNRYLVNLGGEGMEVIHVSSCTVAPEEVDGVSLIPVAAKDHDEARLIARHVVERQLSMLKRSELGEFEYFALRNSSD